MKLVLGKERLRLTDEQVDYLQGSEILNVPRPGYGIRNHPLLIEAVERYPGPDQRIVSLPDNYHWYIHNDWDLGTTYNEHVLAAASVIQNEAGQIVCDCCLTYYT